MQTLNLDIHRPKPANVLIVDDDIDSAIIMDSMFRRFGCITSCTLDFNEAVKRISAGKADILILDWMLGEKVMADKVLLDSIHVIDKFKDLRNRFAHHKTKIISYSTLDEGDLNIPFNHYFEHFDHWQKPVSQKDLIRRANLLLQSVSF